MDGYTYRWQYCRGAADISADFYAVKDADVARAWQGAHGDLLLAELDRADDGRWQFTGASDVFRDLWDGTGTTYEGPTDAMAELDRRTGTPLYRAVCRCDQPGGECD